MATVTITLSDHDERGLEVSVESDPPFPGPAAIDKTCTLAQGWALRLLEVLTDESQGGE